MENQTSKQNAAYVTVGLVRQIKDKETKPQIYRASTVEWTAVGLPLGLSANVVVPDADSCDVSERRDCSNDEHVGVSSLKDRK